MNAMGRLLVGLPSLKGKLENYARRFDLVEVQPVDNPLPKLGRLAAWRQRVPPSFAFNVVLPKAIATFERGVAFEQALQQSLAAAAALQASCIVLATPPSVRPTKANRKRIAELAERLPSTGHVLAWQATGIWEADDFHETARTAGWLPILDAAQEQLPPGPVAYTRIRALGHASRLGADRVTRIAEQLLDRRDAYVVVDPAIAGKVRAGLLAAVGQADTRRNIPQLFQPASFDTDDEEQ